MDGTRATDDAARAFELALDLAIDAASHGAGIIPLSRALTPLCAYADATCDVDTVAGFMRDGHGLAVIGGRRVIALDLEHPRKKGTDGAASIADASDALGPLPRTRATTTKNGGTHLLFSLPNGAKVSPAVEVLRGFGVAIPGVDVVTGAIRLPPTPGYSITCDAPIARLPDAWLRAISDPPAAPEPVRARSRARTHGKAIATVVANVAGLAAQRSAALNSAAFWLAAHVEADDETIVAALMRAAEQNGSIRKRGRRACEGIIRRGLRVGRKAAA